MKTIIGIDAGSEYLPALRLYKNLNIRGAETVLVHAASASVPFVPMGYPAALEAQLQFGQEIENVGRTALEQAKTEACAMDINARTKLLGGSPARILIEEAERSHADLVAVCATHTGRWSASFTGSVSRSLAIGCRSSILIAKGEIESPKKLRAVLATDHSEYADAWIEKFLSFQAKGFGEVQIVCALNYTEWEASILNIGLPEFVGSVSDWLKSQIEEKNAALVARFQAAGIPAKARVIHSPANDAIREAMQDARADILVMGAQGHGFMDRLLIGSVAMHQVMAEPYPVLVVRK